MDTCKPIRKTYDAVLKFLASNHYVAMFIASCPVIYIFGYTVSNSVSTAAIIYASYLSGIGYSFFAFLLLAWGLGCVSIWKKMPNVLTVSIFIYKCIGYWTLVSFMIIVFYVTSYMGTKVAGWLTTGFLPSVMLLLFATDVMRAVRCRLFEELAGSGAAATVVDGGTVATTATAV